LAISFNICIPNEKSVIKAKTIIDGFFQTKLEEEKKTMIVPPHAED